ncbi:c6 zinc finger protein [Colletotrichum incanum]|uniref:C6 zinc finger protein n=1 Tax=Colletotrichum incanum TaxID=1573173 RepID=A0A167A6C8_COLIC|nr:c6 zinc finger protein [Colletotrichum incanum]
MEVLSENREPPQVSKKPHRKSKLGCQTCKRRKIKCDELKPACQNCVRHLVYCDFLKNDPAPLPTPSMHITLHSTANVTDEVVQSVQQTPPVNQDLNLTDLELIHNFSTSVCSTLSADPLVREMWKVSVVRMALKCEYVMRTLLSISALHLAHQQPNRKEALVAKALLYHRSASREAMELMSGLDERNAENLFLFSLLTIFFALASGRYLKESVVVWESAFPDWTFLLSGACSLIKLLNSKKYEGPLTPLLTYAKERFFAARDDSRAQPGALESLRQRVNDSNVDEDLLRIYNLAIDELRHPMSLALHEGGRGMDILDIFIWKYFVSDEFLPLLKTPGANQEAIVIYAHFCIVLKKLESQWWLQGWAMHLISQAWELLDETHKPWIQWPMEELGWAPPA